MAAALIAVLSVAILQGLGGASSTFAAGPCAPSGTEAISTDKADYAPEETVTMRGTGFAADCDLMVRVTRPDGSIVTGDGSFGPWPTAYDAAIAEADGSFIFIYQLDGILGTYTIDVLGEADAVLATMTFTDANSGQVEGGTPTGTCTNADTRLLRTTAPERRALAVKLWSL